MICTIKNDVLTVQISSLGAELYSIKTNDGCEYMWQGDSKYWAGRAPIMFPICGRFFGGKYTYLGKEYEMGSHGIARHCEFSLESQDEASITLSLVGNEETKKSYPFDFVFDVTFTLVDSSLRIGYKVKNTDTKELIFALGAHPAFNVPLENGLSFEDYRVEFEKECDAFRLDLSPTCFCTYEDKLYLGGKTKTIDLKHELFDNDAIFLYNTPKVITLTSDKGSRSVTVKFDNMKYVGLWHATKTDAPYVCIEPWCSIPSGDGVVDDLITKKDMVHLSPESIHSIGYEIIIK
ncbi:MAG: aldose 1-epimerase family protein [Clostridia bacterium]|nr:aldose 1-epimerase family protein [Clostridia bacterium]